MNRFMRKITASGVVVLLGLTTACAELDVGNPNEPDAERSLSTAGDVESLIQGAFGSWWLTSHSANGSVFILANASFQVSSWPANFGMFFYSEIPRAEVVNQPTHQFYGNKLDYVWSRNYRALSALQQGIRSLDEPEIAGDLGDERVQRARAFGKFMQGLAHGSLALFYQQAFIIDETTELFDGAGAPVEQEPVSYTDVLAAALGYFDDAIALSEGASFTIPASWMSVEVSAATLAELAYSMKARYRANVARTPDERAAVDWNAVISDVDDGVDEWVMDLGFFLDPFWSDMVGQLSSRVGWAQVSYMIEGMADTSGSYQAWLSDSPRERFPDHPDESPVLIRTPDQRFPQGDTKDEQLDNPGTMREAWSGSRGQPARGTHRWSHYFNTTLDYHREGGRDVPEVTSHEMRLLRAEGLLRNGDPGAAAQLVNVTREAAGLNATDAAGTNTSCVPRLPSGECGDLMEMLKWEKRLHTAFFGVHANSWYFDGRGWGDLFEGTPLQMPMPCLDAELLFLDCTTTGGVGGEGAAAQSIYGIELTSNWP